MSEAAALPPVGSPLEGNVLGVGAGWPGAPLLLKGWELLLRCLFVVFIPSSNEEGEGWRSALRTSTGRCLRAPALNLALLLLTPQHAHGGEGTVGQRFGFGRTELSAPGDARTAGVTGSENGVFKSIAVRFYQVFVPEMDFGGIHTLQVFLVLVPGAKRLRYSLEKTSVKDLST